MCLQPNKQRDIFEAARDGDVKQLEQCLSNGANATEQDFWRYTPLMFASMGGHVAAVEFLTAHKANVNSTTDAGQFALYYGAIYNHQLACAAVLNAGADKNLTYHGKTAAQWAADQGHKELAAFIESWGQVCLLLSRVVDRIRCCVWFVAFHIRWL